MKEITEDGYRRTSYKTRHRERLDQKIEEFEERGEKTKVIESAGVYYLFVKKEKEL